MFLNVEAAITRERNKNILEEYVEKNWKEGCFNDVTIKAEDDEIEANRMVLASSSLYFEKMFKTEMKEKIQSTVELHDINGTAVKHLIEFIYTGTIAINNENVFDLLSTADYLQIDEAEEFCFEFLQSVINPDTCFVILTVASLYQNEQLKANALECIVENMGVVEFANDLSKKDFITCISKMKANKVNELAIYNAISSWTNFDKISRGEDFLELLFLVDFTKLKVDFIEKMMLSELVTENLACLKFLTKKFADASKANLTKQTETTRVISVGGTKTTAKVFEVHNFVNESQLEIQDLPLPNEYYQLSSAEKRASCIYVVEKRGDQSNIWKLDLSSINAVWKLHRAGSSFVPCTPMINQAAWVDVTSGINIKFCLPHKNKWVDGPKFNEFRIDCKYVSCNGCLYVLGGQGNKTLSSAEHLVSMTGLLKDATWRHIQHMQKPRTVFAAVNCNDQIYAIGGNTSVDKKILKCVERYNPEADEWTYVSSMHFERQRHSACTVFNKIVVVGGVDVNDVAIHEIECYDPSKDEWSIVGKTEEELYDHFLVAI